MFIKCYVNDVLVRTVEVQGERYTPLVLIEQLRTEMTLTESDIISFVPYHSDWQL